MGNSQASVLRQVIEGRPMASQPVNEEDDEPVFPWEKTRDKELGSAVVRAPSEPVTPRAAPGHAGHMKILLENAPIAMAMFDTQMRYLLANRRWLEDFKLTQTEVTGRSQYELFPSLHPGWRHVYERALSGQLVRSDRDAITQDGRPIVYRWEVRPWRHADATIGGVMISCERLLAQPNAVADDCDQGDVPAADSALWRSALPLIALDKSGRIVQFSRGAVTLLPQNSLLGGEAWFWQLVPTAAGQQDAFRRHVQTSLHRVLDDGAPQSVIFTYTAGAPAPTSTSAMPLQWLVSRLEGGLPHVDGDVALVVGLTGASPFAPAVSAAPNSGGLNEELNFELRRQSEENARLRVAEKQATESELVSRQREARLRAVLELAPCGLMVLDEHARPIYRNAQCVALLGRDLAEGQLVESWLTEGSRDEAHRTEIARQWSEGVWRKQLALPLPLVSSDGLLKEVEMRPVSLPGGGLLVMMHDVTEFRRSEEMLRSAEAKYRAVVHENPLPMVLADRTGAVFDVNPAAEELLGHTRAELRCLPLESWLTPEALAQRTLSLQRLHEQGERSAETEVRILHHEGYTFPVKLRLSVVPDAAGKPIFTIHYFSPLPEPPAAPSATTPTEARHVESHTCLLLSTDVHGRIAAWTEEAQERFGFDAAEILGRGLHTLFRPSDPTGFYTELLQVVSNDLDQPQPALWTYSHKTDGRQTGPFLVQRLGGGPSISLLEELMVLTPAAAPLHAPVPNTSLSAHAPEGARLVQAPLTEPIRPSLEELKRERILLGETHHRVKNHLQIITSMLTLQMSTLHNEDAREALRSSQNRIRAIASLHQHLFKLVTEGAGEFHTFLAELIGHLRACYDIAETQVRVQIHLPDKPVPEEWLMPLALAINEMVSNAFKHAFPAHRRGSMSVELNWDDTEGKLTVIDDGVGVPAGFSPHDNLGLGLKILRVFAGQLGGQVTIHSAPGQGAVFQVHFPAASSLAF